MPTLSSHRTHARKGRRGSLIVTSFIIVMGLMIVVAGIQTFLKEQLRQSLEIQRIGFAKLQALYLAEMGINHVMYEANKAANVGLTNPFPLAATTGADVRFDFKSNVAMVRNDASGVADCIVRRLGGNQFQVDAQLTVTNVGSFTRHIQFSSSKVGSYWVLTNYTVMP